MNGFTLLLLFGLILYLYLNRENKSSKRVKRYESTLQFKDPRKSVNIGLDQMLNFCAQCLMFILLVLGRYIVFILGLYPINRRFSLFRF